MIIKRVGGKARLVEWIKPHLPACRIFVDVFGGSGAVLDCMISTKNIRLVFNDLDDKIYTFFRVLQSCGHDFAHLINLTPYSRKVFDKAMDILDNWTRTNNV